MIRVSPTGAPSRSGVAPNVPPQPLQSRKYRAHTARTRALMSLQASRGPLVPGTHVNGALRAPASRMADRETSFLSAPPIGGSRQAAGRGLQAFRSDLLAASCVVHFGVFLVQRLRAQSRPTGDPGPAVSASSGLADLVGLRGNPPTLLGPGRRRTPTLGWHPERGHRRSAVGLSRTTSRRPSIWVDTTGSIRSTPLELD